MTSFADRSRVPGFAPVVAVLGAACAIAFTNAALAATPDAGSAWSADASARLAQALAAQWAIPAERLHVTWSPADGVSAPAAGTPLHLAGRGRDGWVVAVFADAHGTPLAVRARVAVDESTEVATHELAPGLALTGGDLRRELRARWGPSLPGASPVPAPGWVTRRAIAAGDVVAWPAATPPVAVRDGESVEVRWERGGVRVSTRATALQAAAEGARVRVRLADGTVSRDAVVMSAGVVAIQAGGRP